MAASRKKPKKITPIKKFLSSFIKKKNDNTLAISDSDKVELFQNHLSNIFQQHIDIIDI
jgi:hypothetical protein